MVNEIVHIDGYDVYSDEVVKKINVWKDWKNRDKGIVMRIKHGKRVKLIQNFGVYSRIKYKFKTGYLTNWFIKELKEKVLNG